MKKIIVLFPLLAVIFVGCNDFIEKDLTKKTVAILGPASKSGISTTLWWQEIEGALHYNVQVVSPAFDAVERLWADTMVVGNRLDLALVPGSYQWRIKAMNGSSETVFTTASFVIDSSANISSENVVLRSPKDNFASNNLSQIFKWDKLHNVDEYRFRITNGDEVLLKDTTILRGTESSFKFTEDGSYTWQVRGQNDISNTAYFSRTIIIDTKSPSKPTLRQPAHDDFVATDTVRFVWTRVNDAGSPLFDSLYVFQDSNLTDNVLSIKTDKTFYEDLLPFGTYWWYVVTCDAAGNVSEKPTPFKFTKNQ